MRFLIVSLLFFFTAQPAYAALTDNIIAYYKFDESSGTAADELGSYDLTNVNTITYTASVINNGASSGTGNSSKYLHNSSDIVTSDTMNITMAGWITPNQQPSSGTAERYFFVGGNSGLLLYEVFYFNDSGTLKLGAQRQKNGVAGENTIPTQTLSNGTAYHVALTWDGATLLLYLNCSQIGTVSASGNGSTNRGNGITMFSQQTTGGSPLSGNYGSGIVDEYGIWSRALDSSELCELYNSGAGLTYPFVAAGDTEEVPNSFIQIIGSLREFLFRFAV